MDCSVIFNSFASEYFSDFCKLRLFQILQNMFYLFCTLTHLHKNFADSQQLKEQFCSFLPKNCEIK